MGLAHDESLKTAKIYCIGDSHISFFSGENVIQPKYPEPATNHLPYFEVFRLGASLAYSLPNLGTQHLSREKLFEILARYVPHAGHVLLAFGEVDCRMHLVKQAYLQARPLEDIVNECVQRYMSVAQEVKQLGFDVLIWNVTPTTATVYNPGYPTFGTYEERIKAICCFNRELALLCRTYHLKFVTIFEQVSLPNGGANLEYYMDSIHLSQLAMPLAISALKPLLSDINWQTVDLARHIVESRRHQESVLRQKKQPFWINWIDRLKRNRVFRMFKRRYSRPNRRLSAIVDVGFHGDTHILEIVRQLITQASCFIETGTNVGSTARYVAKTYPHLRVLSCEPDEQAFQRASQTLSPFANAQVFNRLSPDFLYHVHKTQPELVGALNLYWLDAHSYGYRWPLHDELKYISSQQESAIIAIDDVQVPNRPEFKYMVDGVQICNRDYILNALSPHKTYHLLYPNYTEHTSPHHPLVGVMFVLYGSRIAVPDAPDFTVEIVTR